MHGSAVAPGDTVLIFTDGLAEATNFQDEAFGTARINSLIPEIRAAVEGLEINEVSEPLELNNSLYLWQVYRITNAASVPFEEVRDQLFSELYQEEEERQIELWIEREKVRSHIERLH